MSLSLPCRYRWMELLAAGRTTTTGRRLVGDLELERSWRWRAPHHHAAGSCAASYAGGSVREAGQVPERRRGADGGVLGSKTRSGGGWGQQALGAFF